MVADEKGLNWIKSYRVSHSDMVFFKWLSGVEKLPICVSSIAFHKSSIGWPQQPPTEIVSDIGKKLDF